MGCLLLGPDMADPVDALYPSPATPICLPQTRFELFPFRSPLLGESFLFLGVLRCFSSPRSLPRAYEFSARYPGIPPGGFPHSDISGSTLVGSSPKLFAACYVLLRPLTPRHPPCALCSLIYVMFACFAYSVQFLRCELRPPRGPRLS